MFQSSFYEFEALLGTRSGSYYRLDLDACHHQGIPRELALEQIDEHIVGPLLAALPRYKDYRILIEPDHRTTLATRAHAHGAVAFAAAGAGITPDAATTYDEPTAATTGLSFDPGWKLMGWFLS